MATLFNSIVLLYQYTRMTLEQAQAVFSCELVFGRSAWSVEAGGRPVLGIEARRQRGARGPLGQARNQGRDAGRVRRAERPQHVRELLGTDRGQPGRHRACTRRLRCHQIRSEDHIM